VGETAARKVGRYEVERELAEGGMGVVYLARQPSLERRVVLKRMRRELADDQEAEQRFMREARTAAAIHHPNVVGVYDCFSWRDVPYIACEYVDGLDAASVIAKSGPLPPRIAALIALEIARGLEELHCRALVHRDLKPDNVLLGRAGEVKIADFGIAHDARAPSLTRTGVSLGTPAYMAPEQLRGERVDPRSDLFALGAVLYEMLAGATPFFLDTKEEDAEPSLLLRIEKARYRSLRRTAPGTPAALVHLVHRCLRAKPKKRFASASELRTALENHVGASPPAEARREIADWLADRKLLPSAGRTRRVKRVEEEGPQARGGVRPGVRFAVAAVVAALLIVLYAERPELPSSGPEWKEIALRWLPGDASDAKTPENSP
jgi:serine/threonine-protein kinase